MKKFAFSLETVKEYKEQMLENVKVEYGVIMAAVKQKEDDIAALEREKHDLNIELNRKNARGITPLEIAGYQRYLNVLHYNIKQEKRKLEELNRQAEKKKDEVIEKRKETASFDKLKEKRLAEYNQQAMKSQEQFIEEFVVNKSLSK